MSDEAYEVGRKAPFFIIALFVLLAMLAGLVWILTSFLAAPVSVHESVYLNVYRERFLSSPDCFAFRDPQTAVVYPGIIDIQKFTDERINECFKKNDRSPYEFYMMLNYADVEKSVRTEDYRLGKGISQFVLVQDGENRIKGKLTLLMQGPQ